MDALRNVLLVTNATTDDEIAQIKQILARVKQPHLAIKLSLVHVIPTLPTCYFNIPSMVVLAERYYDEAKRSLSYVGNYLDIPQSDQWLITGRARSEVLRLANQLNTHFILASSTTIPELHKSYMFGRRVINPTPIRTIAQASLLDGTHQ